MRHWHLTTFLLAALLAACGVPDAPRQPAPPTPASPSAQPAMGQPASAAELVLPDIPAYPGATTFAVRQLAARQLSLDPAQVIGDVQAVTIETADQPLDQFLAVAEFYRQTLPGLGWTLAGELGPATLYRRATAVPGEERGLYVTVRSGQSRHEVSVELAAFRARAPIAPPARSLTPAQTWGHIGDAAVTEVLGIVSGGPDTLFASDSRNQRLLELAMDGTVRRTLSLDAADAAPDSYDAGTLGLAVGRDGRLLAITGGGSRLVRVEPDGSRQLVASGLGDAKGLAVGPGGTIYVTERASDQVVALDPSGAERARWSVLLPDDPEGNASPAFVAVDSAGDVYVTDWLSNRVKKYDRDGRPLLAWGSEGSSPGRFTNPSGIAVGEDGLVYVVDGNPNNRVQIFTPDGALAGIWWPTAGWWERGPTQIYAAEGIAALGGGRFAIGDAGQGDVEILAAGGAAAAVPTLAPAASEAPQPTTTLRRVPSAEEWSAAASAWLAGRPCAAPCWEGITPGRTTVREALDALRSNPLVDPASVVVISARDVRGTDGFDPRAYPDAVAWRWVGGASSPLYGGTAYFGRGAGPQPSLADSLDIGAPISPGEAELGQTIYLVRLNYAAFRADPTRSYQPPALPLALADARAALGAPAQVVATAGGLDWYTLGLIYPDRGVMLLDVGRMRPRLEDAWRPETVVFSDRIVDDARAGLRTESVAPWQAGQPFEHYCRGEGGAPCPPPPAREAAP